MPRWTKQRPTIPRFPRTQRLYWLETHTAIFRWVLKILDEEGLVSGRTVSIDATTLEANAAMKSIVRRDNGQSYNDFLKELARAAGIENPTKERLTGLDRKRKKRARIRCGEKPSDPDAQVTKMKDGRTHLAYKAEHAVDPTTSGALLAMTLQPADKGDTTTIHQTLEAAQTAARDFNEQGVEEVVADKGYHSGAVLTELHGGNPGYIPEPEQGSCGGKWQGKGKAEEQKRTYENRRRVRGERNKRLQKLRSELTERSFAHLYETGGMRRVHLQGRKNILKRLLVHEAPAFNLSLILRKIISRQAPGGYRGFVCSFCALRRPRTCAPTGFGAAALRRK